MFALNHQNNDYDAIMLPMSLNNIIPPNSRGYYIRTSPLYLFSLTYRKSVSCGRFHKKSSCIFKFFFIQISNTPSEYLSRKILNCYHYHPISIFIIHKFPRILIATNTMKSFFLYLVPLGITVTNISDKRKSLTNFSSLQ